MGFAQRVVVDTSTLIGAILLHDSLPRHAFLKALANGTLCASAATLGELENVLMRDKFDRYLELESRTDFYHRYRDQVLLFQVTEADEAALKITSRDPRDNKFLALASICSAMVMISSDQDLLTLNPWQGIPILTPAQFLK